MMAAFRPSEEFTMLRFRVSILGALISAIGLSYGCSSTSEPISDTGPAAPASNAPAQSPDTEATDGQPVSAIPSTPSSSGSSGSSTVPQTIESITDAIKKYDLDIAKAICTKLSECCSSENYAQYFDGYRTKPFDLTVAPTPAQCETTLASQLGKLHGKWATSVTLGRIKYSPARAAKCVVDFNAATCGANFLQTLGDPACVGARDNEVFAKVAPTGSACTDISDGTFFGECDPKLGYCGSDKLCNAWQTKDQPCSITPTRLFCAPDLTCLNPTPSKPGKCSGPSVTRQLGDSCGSSSGPLQLCVAGTFCNWDTNLCEAQKADGAACKYDDECTTSRPYTCSPFGAGTCGQLFCGGKVSK
jgi:hypothetical protein